MGTEEIIISGSKLPVPPPSGSLTDYLLPTMKARDRNRILQINAGTDEKITYGEFLELTFRIAKGLKKLGLVEGDIVSLPGKNSTHVHASALASVCAGGAFVSVEPQIKTFEMQIIYKQIPAKFVLCEAEVADSVSECFKELRKDVTIVIINSLLNFKSTKYSVLEDIIKDIEVDIDEFEPHKFKNPDEQIVFIACSSGSTGVPKGAAHTHKSLLFQLHMWKNLDLHDYEEPTLQTSHFFWISGILFTLVSFDCGCVRAYLSEINHVNLMAAIEKYQPTWALIQAGDILFMLNHPKFKDYDLRSLKYLYTGGSMLSKSVAERIRVEWSETINLFNAYGMTELAGIASINRGEGDVTSVGKAVYETHFKIVDLSTGKTLGSNSVGEVVVTSKGLMKCYLGNEEATKACFDKDGWYRTGDLGYYDENHCFFIVDRIKEIIKYRNLQISPAEVEVYVESLQGVKEAAMVGIPHELDIYHPLLLVVKLPNSNITEDYIIKAVKENLSEYKTPRAGVIFVKELPRTPTGKLKRISVKEMAKVLYEEKLTRMPIAHN